MIDESNNRLPSLTHSKCRSGNLAIVSNKSRLFQPGVDLDIYRLDVDLVVVKGGTVGVLNRARCFLDTETQDQRFWQRTISV